MFIDIHTHHTFSAGHPSIRNLTFLEAEQLFLSDSERLFSVGFHPWDVDAFSEKSMGMLEKWAGDKRFVLVGECGFDKNSKASITLQTSVFERQILLSERIQKPMIIHCVGCFNELLVLKKKYKPQQMWIIHGFRGKPQLAEQLLKSGCALSFGEHHNPASVLVTPINRLFLETDESVMDIERIYHHIAKIRQVEPEQLTAGVSFYDKIGL